MITLIEASFSVMRDNRHYRIDFSRSVITIWLEREKATLDNRGGLYEPTIDDCDQLITKLLIQEDKIKRRSKDLGLKIFK